MIPLLRLFGVARLRPFLELGGMGLVRGVATVLGNGLDGGRMEKSKFVHLIVSICQ